MKQIYFCTARFSSDSPLRVTKESVHNSSGKSVVFEKRQKIPVFRRNHQVNEKRLAFYKRFHVRERRKVRILNKTS